MTWRQMQERTKFVTRREGWWLGDYWKCGHCHRIHGTDPCLPCRCCGSNGYAVRVERDEPRKPLAEALDEAQRIGRGE